MFFIKKTAILPLLLSQWLIMCMLTIWQFLWQIVELCRFLLILTLVLSDASVGFPCKNGLVVVSMAMVLQSVPKCLERSQKCSKSALICWMMFPLGLWVNSFCRQGTATFWHPSSEMCVFCFSIEWKIFTTYPALLILHPLVCDLLDV